MLKQLRVAEKATLIDDEITKVSDDITAVNTKGIIDGFKSESLGLIPEGGTTTSNKFKGS